MKIDAVVLERTGGTLELQQLDLAPPGAEEVLVRLGASGVCHSDFNAIDGTAETPCPAVLGHEGAGVVEAIGPGVTRVAVGDHVALSWAPSCGGCGECLRDLPQLCSTAWQAMATGGLMDGTTRLSRDGEPVFHYWFLSTLADARRAGASCVAIAEDIPLDIAALVGCAVTTGAGAVWRTAGVQPGGQRRGHWLWRRRAVAVMAAVAVGRRADRGSRRRTGETRGAVRSGRPGRVEWSGGPDETAARFARRRAGGSTSRSRRPDARGQAGGLLSTRAKGAAVLIGIPRRRRSELPALSIPRMERRVLGRSTARPARARLPGLLDLYRRGRLPSTGSSPAPPARRGRSGLRAHEAGRRGASCSNGRRSRVNIDDPGRADRRRGRAA